jgi:N-acyl-D-amino-acid deacylase
MELDLKIAGGQVADGTGAPLRRADVGILAGRITEVGDLSAAPARRVVDAAEKMVCPGFIDSHSHSDSYLLLEPSAPSKIYQGVTTEVVGNCGASAAPLLGLSKLPSDWEDKTYPGRWRTMAEYRALLESVRPAVNAVPLAGHGKLRAAVMGYEARAARPDEVREMARLLECAMDEGAAGLSTGLIYAPGMYAAPEEVAALAAVAARRNGIYTTHMRSEGAGLLEAIDEALAVSRRSGVRLCISHLKTSGRGNWHLLEAALGRIEAARAEGLSVAADRYPYIASNTDLDVILPAWAAGGGREAVLARLADPETRLRLRTELLANRPETYWGTVVIGSTAHPDHAGLQGKPLDEAARMLGLEPVDAALTLIEKDGLRTSAFFFGMSEENMWRILAQPWVMIGSDASVRAPAGVLSHDYPHPRAYGTFPRFLRAALDGKTVSPVEAIRKMTSLPAAHFRLTGRGVLRKGAAADVLVLDPERVRDVSTFAAPHALSEGVDLVAVNGVVTLEAGALTGNRGGRVLA